MSDLERKIANLESQYQQVNATLATLRATIGNNVAPITTGATNSGAIINQLRTIFNKGFVWVGRKVDIKLQTNPGLVLSDAGLSALLKTGGGLGKDVNGLYVVGIGLSHYLTAQFDKNNATLTDIPGLSITLVDGKKYWFKAVLFFNADATGGHQYAMSGGVTPNKIIYQINSISNVPAIVLASTQVALDGADGEVGALAGMTEISGFIDVTTGGTLIPQFAQSTANLTSSILLGSYFLLQEII